jgi:Aminotransferase class I and II
MRPSADIVAVNAGSVSNTLSRKILPLLRDALDKSPKRIRALVLTNPHNPFGQCYPLDVLEACVQFCQDRDIHFISDEVYALSCFDNNDKMDNGRPPFVSALHLDLDRLGVDRARVHVVWSTSKDFGSSGFRMVCLAALLPLRQYVHSFLWSIVHIFTGIFSDLGFRSHARQQPSEIKSGAPIEHPDLIADKHRHHCTAHQRQTPVTDRPQQKPPVRGVRRGDKLPAATPHPVCARNSGTLRLCQDSAGRAHLGGGRRRVEETQRSRRSGVSWQDVSLGRRREGLGEDHFCR